MELIGFGTEKIREYMDQLYEQMFGLSNTLGVTFDLASQLDFDEQSMTLKFIFD